jgi:methylornithine synthase
MEGSIGNLEQILEKAEQQLVLSRSETLSLLKTEIPETELIFRSARALRNKYFQNQVFLYGFIYFSTWCRKDCAFCYYRRSNHQIPRYRKTDAEILEAAASLVESGAHLIDLTSGEDPDYLMQPGGYEQLAALVNTVKTRFGLPVMVSPGVVPKVALQQFAAAGADWYACYQETHSRTLFERLRLNQSVDERWETKLLARRYGLLIEEGILKGVGENAYDVADSLKCMESIGAQQVRVMSFVPQAGTPMAAWTSPDRIEELKVIAVMRLLFPDRLIPASLDVDGVSGLQARLNAGANVVTSLIPPRLGLAGVAQSARGIEDGCRTVAGILPVLDEMGLEPAALERYRNWVESEKRKLHVQNEERLVLAQ